MARTGKTLERRKKVALKHEGWASGKPRTLDIRSGDTVEVLTGKDRGKRGQVERVLFETQRIVVAGVNIAKRHTRANTQGNMQGGIVDFNAPLAYSNVALVCNRCDKRTRIGYDIDEQGNTYQMCKKCGERYERVNV